MEDGIKKIEDSGVSNIVPLEYWETCDARQGGGIEDINEKGLLIRSPVNMPIGGELRIKVFFSTGIKFDEFQTSVKVIGKELYCLEGWEAYGYQLEFIRISAEDRLGLRRLLSMRQPKEICS